TGGPWPALYVRRRKGESHLSVRRCAMLSCVLVALLCPAAFAQTSVTAPRVPAPTLPPSQTQIPALPVTRPVVKNDTDEGPGWIEGRHRCLDGVLWRSAMNVDHWFGGDMPAHAYADQTRGSITPVVLWDEHDNFQEKLRFRVNIPLPYIGQRFNAFAGTFTR